jgi:hypothetical protein
MSAVDPNICFFIASIGQKSLKNTLRSLYGQFGYGKDKVYLYFDGRCDAGVKYFQEEYDLYGSDLIVTMLPGNLGHWGHGIRNKFLSQLPCDYIHNMDDDDAYYPDVIPSVKQDIINNYGKLLIYKFKNWNNYSP